MSIAWDTSVTLLRDTPQADAYQRCVGLTPKLSQSLAQFWEQPHIHAHTFYVGEEEPYFSQVQRWLELPDSFFKFSHLATETLLKGMLGESHKEFTGWSALENEVLRQCGLHLSRELELPTGLSHPSGKYWVIQWILDWDDWYAGTLMILWPKRLLQKLPLPDPPTLTPHWYQGVGVMVDVSVGRTLIPLEGLQQLEVGDIVVLDDSTPGELFVEIDHESLRFLADMSPVPHLPQSPVDDDDETDSTSTVTWDHLMVEVSAEFLPFLLPLKEVRAMSEGLLVEVDDLLHNQIRLHSQGTVIAQGSLVIVGDKFAVRVEQVLGQPLPEPTQSNTQHSIDIKNDAPSQEREAVSQTEAAQVDNTDPDTFLNQDFDTEDQEQW